MEADESNATEGALAQAGVLGLNVWFVLALVPAFEHGLGAGAAALGAAALAPLGLGLWLAARERAGADVALLALFPAAAAAAAVSRADGGVAVLGSALGVSVLAASLLGYGAACLHLLGRRRRSRQAEHHPLAEGESGVARPARVRIAQRALLAVTGAAAMGLAVLGPLAPLPGSARGAVATASPAGPSGGLGGAGAAREGARAVGAAVAEAGAAWGDAAPQGLLLVAVVSSGLGVALLAAFVGPALRADRTRRPPRRRALLVALGLLAAVTGLAALAAYRAAAG